MLRLLSIEFHKFKYNKPSRILTLIYFGLLTSIALIAIIKFDIGIIQFHLADMGIFNFPYIWHFNTYMASLFKFFLLLVIVSMISNEYSYKTLKQNLIERGEATELFAKPRGDGLSALLGNLNQSIFGEAAYPTIESKAAHLLYFMVKNHPFTDGNKRSGAFLFVDFLHRNQRLYNPQGHPCINDTGLAALTLLVAESKPDQKETLIRLIMNMLAQETT